MELYIGGYAQGKLAYVKRLYPDAKKFDENDFDCLWDFSNLDSQKVIINHFHLIIKKGLDEEKIEKLLKYKNNLVIISDEIGGGVVPIEESERIYREKTGRILTRLASESESVVRIICGLAQRIK